MTAAGLICQAATPTTGPGQLAFPHPSDICDPIALATGEKG